MSTIAEKFENVTVVCKANLYFGGKVASHTILTPAGKKTLGLIYPGQYNFNTGAPERMEIVSGVCRVKVAGSPEETYYKAGSFFLVPGNSSFDIAVDDGVLEYICSFE